jgi:hypothetical protein
VDSTGFLRGPIWHHLLAAGLVNEIELARLVDKVRNIGRRWITPEKRACGRSGTGSSASQGVRVTKSLSCFSRVSSRLNGGPHEYWAEARVSRALTGVSC